MANANPIPQTFHASVADHAISKVTRLFNASLDDIFAEMFQNARRAGASKICVDQFEHSELGPVISISDNGPGLEDPRHLFTLGQSDWSRETIEEEDAAGMGFFSLAGRRVKITAQQAGHSSSWVINADPESFAGQDPITCAPGPNDHKGVSILIAAHPNENCLPAVNHAAEYFPLPVIAEGVEVERKDFLEKADHIAEWNGIRIGFYQETLSFKRQHHNVNFHGVTLNASLPSIGQSHHRSYHAKLDVLNCPELKLVLPARKEVVQNAFLDELRRQILIAFFSHIADAGAHTLSFKDHQRAKGLGIALPPSAPMLRPFAPENADRDSNELHTPVVAGRDALLFEGTDNPIDDQNLAEAISQDDETPKLYEPNSAFEGYDWYDRLNVVSIDGYEVAYEDRHLRLGFGDVSNDQARPDHLFVLGEISNGVDSSPWRIETDRLVLGPEGAHIDEAEIVVVQTSKATHADLVDLLTRALFCPSDDHDAGRYDDQLQWFTDEAEDAVIAYLETLDELRINQTTRTIRRELYWLLKSSADITIRIRGREIDVFGLETAFIAAKA